MAFADAFSDALNEFGLLVAAREVPAQDDVQLGLEGLERWLDSLDPDTRSAAEAVTGTFPVKAGLAAPEVAVAPGLLPVLAAADRARLSLGITQLAGITRKAFERAATPRA